MTISDHFKPLEAPFFVSEPPTTFGGTEGIEVRINCEADGQPKPTVNWRKTDGGVLLLKRDLQSFLMQIHQE